MSMNDINRLSHTSWNCKYHIVFAPKYRRKVFYNLNSPKIIQRYLKSSKIKQILRKLAKTA